MTGAEALHALEIACADPLRQARAWKAAGGGVVGFLGAGVPAELIEAHGLLALRLSGGPPRATPLADRWMEPVHDPALRRTFEALLAGDFAACDLVVVSRAAEGLLQLYHLARHVQAQGEAPGLPPLHLFDLLQTPGPLAVAYVRDRLAELDDRLAALSGRRPGPEGLRAAIRRRNALRMRLRALCRRPGIGGVLRLRLVAAAQTMPPEALAPLLEALEADPPAAPPAGPRLALAGSPDETGEIAAALEALGARVVAEDHDRGGRLLRHDVPAGADPLADLAAHLNARAPGPRCMEPALPEVDPWDGGGPPDGVLMVCEVHDDTFGWDYPELRDRLRAAGIAVAMVRGGETPAAAAARSAALEAFVAGLRRGPDGRGAREGGDG